jgi:hypothetical protein
MSDRALQLGQTAGDFNAELLHHAQGLLRAVDAGLATDVLPLLLGAADYQRLASFDAGAALCAALAGEHSLSEERIVRVLNFGLQGSPRGADWLAPWRSWPTPAGSLAASTTPTACTACFPGSEQES